VISTCIGEGSYRSFGALRALVVDDEPVARRRLKTLLAAEQADVIGECETGEQAIEAIERLRPDVVFLDVQMPGSTDSTSSTRSGRASTRRSCS
jgi:CheY-like chemotaxis protein